jgi:hypothetical protein
MEVADSFHGVQVQFITLNICSLADNVLRVVEGLVEKIVHRLVCTRKVVLVKAVMDFYGKRLTGRLVCITPSQNVEISILLN